MNPQLQKGLLLLDQQRWADALAEFSKVLVETPYDHMALSWSAICLSNLDRLDEAEARANEAIHAAPAADYPFYVLSQVLSDRNRTDDALEAIEQALEISPADPDYLGWAAMLHLDQKSWAKAREMAEMGLEFSPKSSICCNARARALVGMGDLEGSEAELRQRLADNPNDPYAHANLGWVALEAGRREAALEHFQQALQIKPEFGWAREGLMQALRARYPLYKFILGYFLWMSKLSKGTQWGVILGGYFLFRMLGKTARENPDLQMVLMPVLLAYFLFVYLSWTGTAVCNMFLRMNPYGRSLLNAQEINDATMVGLSLGCAVAALVAEQFTTAGLWIVAVVLLVQSILIPTISACDEGWPRKTMLGLTWGTSILGLGGYAGSCLDLPLGWLMLGVYMKVIFFVVLGSNYLLSVEVKR